VANDDTTAEKKPDDAKKTDPVLTEIMGLFKELSLALIENAKANRAILSALITTTNHEGDEVPGLIDSLSELQDSVDSLDNHVVGQNIMLSRFSFAADRMLAIYKGDPSAAPLEAGKKPEPGLAYPQGRTPGFEDVCAALNEFDEKLAEEADQLDKEDEPPMPDPGQETPAPTPMIGNSKKTPPPPVFGKQLPPPPVFGKK
jgi:hypothetical protein